MKRIIMALLLIAMIGLVGCSGLADALSNVLHMSGTNRIDQYDRRNVDGSYGELQRFTATQDGPIYVHMKRTNNASVYDPYIVVWHGTANDWTNYTLVDYDDDSGQGRNAYLRFYAYDGERFTVLFTTYGSNDFGSYRYIITERSGYSTASIQAALQGNKNVSVEQKLSKSNE